MRISLAGQAFVGSWEWDGKEGFDTSKGLFFPYYDYVGKRFVKIGDLVSARRYLTIGWGHVVKAGEDFSAGVTLDRLHAIFESDLLGVELAIDEHVTAPLNQNQYDALVDFGHNEGAGRLRPENNAMIRLLNAGDYGAVARIDAAGNVQGHILDWDVVNGAHDPGLLERRRQEGRMWCSDAPSTPDERAAALLAESTRIAAERAASVQFGLLDLLPTGRE